MTSGVKKDTAKNRRKQSRIELEFVFDVNIVVFHFTGERVLTEDFMTLKEIIWKT